jgi:hypothetical protein
VGLDEELARCAVAGNVGHVVSVREGGAESAPAGSLV